MAESMSDEADALREIKQEKPDSQLNTDRSKECSSTPPSSPPVLKPEALETARLSPSRKRSQEEMNAEAESANESSMTIVDEIDRSARQNQPTAKEVDSSATKMSSAHAHSMPPPPAPASIKLPPSQKPSRSGQGSQNTQNSQSQMREPEKTTQSANETLDGNSSKDDAMNDYTESSESLVTGDPKVKIEDFNWRNLQERYHAKMKELNATEHNILAEFENLCNVSDHLNGRLTSPLTSSSSTSASGLRPDRIVKSTDPSSGNVVTSTHSGY